MKIHAAKSAVYADVFGISLLMLMLGPILVVVGLCMAGVLGTATEIPPLIGAGILGSLAIPLGWIVRYRIRAIRMNLSVPEEDARSWYDGAFWRRLY